MVGVVLLPVPEFFTHNFFDDLSRDFLYYFLHDFNRDFLDDFNSLLFGILFYPGSNP